MVNSFVDLVDIDLAGWERLHRRAMGVGCGCVLDRDDERVAAADELIALALVELVGLSALAVAATDPQGDTTHVDDTYEDLCRMVASVAAGALRLIDRALVAHGRDVGYSTDAWLDTAIASGAAITSALASGEDPAVCLFASVCQAAGCAVGAFLALARDRLAVAPALSDALGHVLIVYAAAVTTAGSPDPRRGHDGDGVGV